MPRRPLKQRMSSESERLVERLAEEFRSPAPSGRPLLEKNGVAYDPRWLV